MLKKEFNKKDVTRMRNLVKGKTGAKIGSSVGYTKKQSFHKEGDVWEEDGRTWTIQDGIKQNITKHDKAKKAHLMPLLCPNCNKVMKNRNDKSYYNLHKKCFECVILFEAKLKREGKWDEYQRTIQNDEIDNMITNFKTFMNEKLDEKSRGYVSEDGDVERWIGKVDRERAEEHIKEAVEYLEALKK